MDDKDDFVHVTLLLIVLYTFRRQNDLSVHDLYLI